MKKNVWHSIEQDASIDQWHSRLKTRICAEGVHFKHMAEINLYRKTKKYHSSWTFTVIKIKLIKIKLNVFHHFELN